MKKKLLLFILLPSYSVIAQAGIGTMTPYSDAVLDATDTNRLLFPKFSLTATHFATSIATHLAGNIHNLNLTS